MNMCLLLNSSHTKQSKLTLRLIIVFIIYSKVHSQVGNVYLNPNKTKNDGIYKSSLSSSSLSYINHTKSNNNSVSLDENNKFCLIITIFIVILLVIIVISTYYLLQILNEMKVNKKIKFNLSKNEFNKYFKRKVRNKVFEDVSTI